MTLPPLLLPLFPPWTATPAVLLMLLVLLRTRLLLLRQVQVLGKGAPLLVA